jgi:hypothetical protein
LYQGASWEPVLSEVEERAVLTENKEGFHSLMKNSETADSSHSLTAQARLRAARNDKIKELTGTTKVVPSRILRDLRTFSANCLADCLDEFDFFSKLLDLSEYD